MSTLSKKHIFFHVGLPKTGSTYLQDLIFPRLTGLDYYGKRAFNRFHEIIESSESEKFLFSKELDRKLERKLREISEKYPSAKIIIVFRPHASWLKSKYYYYIRKHGHLSFDDFFSLEKKDSKWKIEETYYKNKIDLIESLFDSTPLVLNFNELKDNPEQYLKRILDYMDVEYSKGANISKVVKKAFTPTQLKVILAYNRLFRYHKSFHKVKVIRRFHYRYRQILLHIVAQLARILPANKKDAELLISKSQLDKITQFYNDDWDYCVHYNENDDNK